MNPSDLQYNPLCRRGLSPWEAALAVAILGLPLLAVVGLLPWFMELEQGSGIIARECSITPAAEPYEHAHPVGPVLMDASGSPRKVVELAAVMEGGGE